MAKPNYSFEKRQKEIAKKRKKEEKLKEKAHAKLNPQAEPEAVSHTAGIAPDESEPTPPAQ
jgi:hypothetical protein